jgi:uncharacterized Zn finger protein (UPF0148 family)
MEMMYSNIKKCNQRTVALFEQCVLNALDFGITTEVKNLKAKSDLILKLRNQKREFIEATMPIAVVELINIIYSSQLKKIKKGNLELIDKTIAQQRSCFKILCNGKLDENYYCNSCFTTFCKDCEKTLPNNHQCSQDDLESLAFISNLVKCPKCKFPVIKSEGCNDITCSVCRTNFYYVTGELSRHGNHTANEPSTVIKSNVDTLYKRYSSSYPRLGNIFIQLDNLKPKRTAYNTLVSFLKNETQDIKLLNEHYEKYVIYKYKTTRYTRVIDEIEELHTTNKITHRNLNNYIQILH